MDEHSWTSARNGGSAKQNNPCRTRALHTSILEDRQLNDREYWIEIPHPQMHAYRQQGNMWPLVTARAATRRHSPLFGEHNTEILQGELGLTDDQLAELTTALVIARAPINPSVG